MEEGKGFASCVVRSPVPEEALTAESTTSSVHLCPSLLTTQSSDNMGSGSLIKTARRILRALWRPDPDTKTSTGEGKIMRTKRRAWELGQEAQRCSGGKGALSIRPCDGKAPSGPLMWPRAVAQQLSLVGPGVGGRCGASLWEFSPLSPMQGSASHCLLFNPKQWSQPVSAK